MPLIKYRCKNCYNVQSKIFKVKDIVDKIKCNRCGQQSDRELGRISSKSIITVDNGVQPRAVELDSRFQDFENERKSFKK